MPSGSLTLRRRALLRHAWQPGFPFGTKFCARSGAHLLADPLIVTLYGEPVLVMHGDALCTDDRAYQRLRATVRDADWQRRFLVSFGRAAPALAGAARDGSRAHTAAIAYTIGDVNTESVARRDEGRRRDRRCCTATRTGPASIPSRSTGGPARASCSATGTRREASSAGTRAVRSCRSLPRESARRSETGTAVAGHRSAPPPARRRPRCAAAASMPARVGGAPRQLEIELEMPRFRLVQASNIAPGGTAEHGAKAAKRSQERASMKAPQIIRSTSRCGLALAPPAAAGARHSAPAPAAAARSRACAMSFATCS